MNNRLPKIISYIAPTLVVAMFFIIDRYLKQIAISLPSQQSYSIIGNFFNFYFTPNNYIAFSIPLSGHFLNYIIIILICFLVIYLIASIKKGASRYELVGLALMILGAISNIVDRFSHGFVVDYLLLRYFTVFNLADVMICLGAIILIYKNLNKPKQ